MGGPLCHLRSCHLLPARLEGMGKITALSRLSKCREEVLSIGDQEIKISNKLEDRLKEVVSSKDSWPPVGQEGWDNLPLRRLLPAQKTWLRPPDIDKDLGGRGPPAQAL